MKKIIYTLALLPVLLYGQDNTYNYVRAYTYKEATYFSDEAKANATVTYYDAIGRPIQQIAGKMSGNGKDIVTHIKYDAYGRQEYSYLPYASENSNLAFNGTAEVNTYTFYNTSQYENTPNPYSRSFFESSPLNRVLKQAAPGAAWIGDPGSNDDKTVKFAYRANVQNEVKRLSATATWNNTTGIYDIAFADLGYYSEAQLNKSIVTNENGASTEEFKNMQGQVLLKRAYDRDEKYDTYYVYDQFGNLTYVIPPLAEGLLDPGLCYYYKYDHRNRLAEKKIPGKQWEYIVYDILDRVVATGPALSPFGVAATEGWMYTFYDTMSRPAFTGWYAAAGINSNARAALQAQHTGAVSNVQRSSDIIDNIPVGYKRTIIPPGFKLLTINYYDTYASDAYPWPGGPETPASSMIIEGQPVMAIPKGLPVGSWTRVLDSPTGTTGETSYTLYDEKGRPVRTYMANYIGGYTQADTKLDFDGTPQYT
ncbi:hypothetical protein CHU92_10765, partial [Flavobacterium cyanobacteriorum]